MASYIARNIVKSPAALGLAQQQLGNYESVINKIASGWEKTQPDQSTQNITANVYYIILM